MTPPAPSGSASQENFHGHKHPYHLVDPSPWPVVGAIDVVWLFLFTCIYWWGSGTPAAQ